MLTRWCGGALSEACRTEGGEHALVSRSSRSGLYKYRTSGALWGDASGSRSSRSGLYR